MKKYIFILLIAITLPSLLNAQTARMQAAYIYSLSKYMKWPAGCEQGSFVIGVFTNDPIVIELKKIASVKNYANQKIEIKVFKNIDEIQKTHVLYVPAKNTSEMNIIISKIRKNNTLIIGNNNKAIGMGAGINFVDAGNKVTYEVKSVNIIKKQIQVIKKVEFMASKVY